VACATDGEDSRFSEDAIKVWTYVLTQAVRCGQEKHRWENWWMLEDGSRNFMLQREKEKL
jgi:hypothetical protein